MVTLLPEVETFGSAFGKSFGGGIGKGAKEGLQSSVNKNMLAQENKEILDSTGIDLSAYTDPQMREKAFASQLQGKNQMQLEGFKQQGKQDLYTKKQQDLAQALKGQNRSFENQESPLKENGQQFDPSKLSDESIAQVTSIDPNVGRVLQAQKQAAIQQSQKERQLLQTDIKQAYKTNEGYINKITDQAQAADEMDMRLDQMLSLKDLPTPLMATTLESLGLPPAMFSADAETADKLSIDLTKNIQQFYGNRILQSEFQAFLKSIPSLKNTPEGRQRIIKNMKAFNDLKRLEFEKMREKELEFEEKNKPIPNSFRRQVLADMKPEAEKIAKQFAISNRQHKKIKPMKVKQGTKISDEMIDEYIMNSNGDLEAAKKSALADGYDID